MLIYLYFIFVVLFVFASFYRIIYIKKFKPNKEKPFTTIVVPAKDEEDNIADIIECLVKQNYPKESYEILIINDRSVDKTEAIIQSYQAQYPLIHLITIKEENPALFGKQNALDVGIRAAKGEIILLTDADCIISKTWLANMVKMFNTDKVGLVVGKTEIFDPKTFWERFQVLSHRILLELAQVPVMFGQYTSGMGNNLAILKKAYIEIGGYPSLGKSILDDEILVRGIAKAGYDLRAGFYRGATVYTKPMPNMKALQKQHIRWIDGGLHYKSPTRFGLLVNYLFNIYMFYLLLHFIIFRDVSSIALILIRIAADAIFLFNLNRGQRTEKIGFFETVLCAILIPYHVFYLTTKSLFFTKKIVWKDEQVKR